MNGFDCGKSSNSIWSLSYVRFEPFDRTLDVLIKLRRREKKMVNKFFFRLPLSEKINLSFDN